jgi:hypothetical protein
MRSSERIFGRKSKPQAGRAARIDLGYTGGVWKKIVAGAGALLGLAVIAGVAYIGPRNVVGMLRYDIRSEGTFTVGDRAPDVALLSLDNTQVHLGQRFGERPVVLVFGSFT